MSKPDDNTDKKINWGAILMAAGGVIFAYKGLEEAIKQLAIVFIDEDPKPSSSTLEDKSKEETDEDGDNYGIQSNTTPPKPSV